MKITKLYVLLSISFCLLSNFLFAQAFDSLFYNNGDQVYVQGGALLHIQGGLTNKNGSGAKTITNNGVMQVEGNIVNENGALFVTDGSVAEGAVRLIGGSTVPGGSNNDQTIAGTFNDATNAYFYNLVVDKEAAGNTVTLNTDLLVKGTLLWNGAANDGNTYNHSTVNTTVGGTAAAPSRTNPVRSGNGLVKLYSGTNDYELYVSNPAPTSLVGYKSISSFNYSSNPAALSGTANDGYVQTRGAAAVAKGLSLQVDRAGVYTFPVGSPTSTYNPVKVNFNGTPGSAMKLTSKFSENDYSGSSITNTFDQTNSLSPAGPASVYFANHPIDYANNPGFNIYQQSSCGGSPKWFIMDKILKNHGYWSFNASPALSGTTYVIEAYPHGYSEYVTNGSNPNKRILRTSAGGFTTAPTVSDFQAELETSVAPNYSDLLTYTYIGGSSSNYFTSCGNADGIVGGRYSSFSNFGIGTSSSNTGNALPVKLISLEATPVNNAYIRVLWATASEIDNKGFEVMRSDDGVNFAKIGWVDGNGTTAEQHDYLLNDKNVLPNVTYYYKLNQIDFDGKNSITYIVSAKITDGPDFVLSDFMPNPTIGTTKLVVSTTDAMPATVKFFDMLGQEVLSHDYQLVSGTNSLDFDMNAMAAATYTAVIRVGANSYSKRLVVAR